MARFMDAKFPQGLLNPGPSIVPTRVLGEGPSWCVRTLGVACPNRRELLYNLFLSSGGVWLLLPLSVVVLLLYRLVGPPEVRFLCLPWLVRLLIRGSGIGVDFVLWFCGLVPEATSSSSELYSQRCTTQSI